MRRGYFYSDLTKSRFNSITERHLVYLLYTSAMVQGFVRLYQSKSYSETFYSKYGRKLIVIPSFGFESLLKITLQYQEILKADF